MTDDGGALEVIEEEPHGAVPPAGPEGFARRHWKVSALAAAVVVLLVVGTIQARDLLAADSLRALEQAWREHQELSVAYNRAVSDARLDTPTVSGLAFDGKGDPDPVVRQITRTYAAELRRRRDRIDDVRAFDDDARRLKQAMTRAIDRTVELAEGSTRHEDIRVGPFVEEGLFEVTQAMHATLRKAGLRPATGRIDVALPGQATRPPPNPLLSEPTGARLVTRSGDDLLEIEVDTGVVRAMAKDSPGGIDIWVARDNWVAWTSGSSAYGRTIGTRPRDDIGYCDFVVASADPGRVWLVNDTADGTPGEGFEATEVDRGGTRTDTITGPGVLRWVTADHLVTGRFSEGERELVVTERRSGKVVRRIGGASLIDARSTLVVWRDDFTLPVQAGEGALHVLDLASGADRVVSPPAAVSFALDAVLSPDGRTLAVNWGVIEERRVRSRIGLHSLESLAAPALVDADPELVAPSMAWTPRGDRLFFTLRDVPASSERLGTMRVADGKVERLRLRGHFRDLAAF